MGIGFFVLASGLIFLRVGDIFLLLPFWWVVFLRFLVAISHFWGGDFAAVFWGVFALTFFVACPLPRGAVSKREISALPLAL